MTITVVSLSLNEADVATKWAQHYWAQGVDRIVVADGMSKDGTADLLRAEGVEVIEDHEPFCYQGKLVSTIAASVGEGWIIPADLDEWWVASDHLSLEHCLNSQPEDVGKVWALMFNHTDWEHRWPEPRHLPKVAFRWSPDAQVAMGAHSVECVPGNDRSGLLQVREIQYRSREHFRRKVRDRLATLDPGLKPGDAAHYKMLDGLTDKQLDAEWDELQKHPTIFDPITAIERSTA